MYAVSLGSATYHLIQPRTNRTLCGLKVRPLRVKLRTGLTFTPTSHWTRLSVNIAFEWQNRANHPLTRKVMVLQPALLVLGLCQKSDTLYVP